MEIKNWIEKAKTELEKLDLGQVRTSGILPSEGKFFPVIGYPPLTMYPEMDEKSILGDVQNRPVNPMIAYVHIPFCPSRCTFCHWITKTKSRADEVDDYLDHLEKEMVLYRTKLGVDKIPVESVLVGGGTPTYLSAKQMERFLSAFTNNFDLSNCTQFSLEPEPTTILGDEGLEKLKIMKDYGVNRLSMGVQSFDDKVLARMGRVHKHADTLKALEQINKAGIENTFIDLIYGYPDQSIEQWTKTMQEAVTLDIDGFQLYRLRIKPHGDRPGNILKVYDKKAESFPEVDKIYLMKMLGLVISRENGFDEQQTRIFARKAESISHYLRDSCCHLSDVVGVGVSSWSNLRGVFSLNVGDESLEQYYQLIDEGKVSVNRGLVRTHDDEVRRRFILPLKNSFVHKQTFNLVTGETVQDYFGEKIQWLKKLGLLDEDKEKVFMTARGRFFADEVAMQFFSEKYLPFPELACAS